jgi:serine/threonine protein kinase
LLGPEIGRGSMGVVYEAQHIGQPGRVAIKLLLPRALVFDGVVERFQRGAVLAASLTGPHAVAIHHIGVHEPRADVEPLPFMVMEYLEGRDLFQHISRHGQLSAEQSVSILQQVLASLEEAHDKGIIHRDLKPENLFLVGSEEDFQVKVLDFGLAKAITEGWGNLARRLTATGMTCGTPEYMAPEQAVGEDKVGPELDVYALGCIAFHMLCGRPPFDGASPIAIALQHVQTPPPDLPAPYAGTYLDHVVRRCLAKDPQIRFQDATALRLALDQGAAGDDLTSRPDWPHPEDLERSYRASIADVTEPAGIQLLDSPGDTIQGAHLGPMAFATTLEVSPDGREDWMRADTLQSTPSIHQEAAGWTAGGTLGPGQILVDLEAPLSGDFNEGEMVGSPTVITRPDRPAPPPIPLPGKLPTAIAPRMVPPPRRGRGGNAALWIMIGIAVMLAMSAVAITAAIWIPKNAPAPVAASEVAVTVHSTPAGAAVRDGAISLGRTPLTLTRPEGEPDAALTVEKSGFAPGRVVVSFTDDRRYDVQLKPKHEAW